MFFPHRRMGMGVGVRPPRADSWEAFFGLGQRKPPRPRKESRFGWFNMPGIGFNLAVRHRYVGIPWTLRDWGAVIFARRRFAPERLPGRFVERPRSTGIPWGAFFGLGQRKRPRPRKESRLGGLICRGVRVTRRFDVDTLVSLKLYETGVLSFPRDGALRRSAYVGN